MSIRYAIAEHPHRWLILAGVAFLATLTGTIFILAFEWSHTVARIWLYLGLLVTLACLVLAFLDWKRHVEEIIDEVSPSPPDDEETG